MRRTRPYTGLNTPFGARCFLTRACAGWRAVGVLVLMHLLALGAF